MRRLILFRHAKSEWPAGVADDKRPLAKRGRRTAPLMGAFLARENLLPDLALVSTARRAMETWELAYAEFGSKVAWKAEPRLYDAPVSALFDIVRQMPSNIRTLMLVGHNPGFEVFAGQLTTEGPELDLSRLREKLPTAAIAVIDFNIDGWKAIDAEHGVLKRFETPRSVEGAN
ncbi:MAG: histidine phosphatase family protein [Phyllobacterium sp.]|uniref:SixA phosphatase family protein n=1 Tax=Phyllobacterium sp. TaxID=1871046 RepID=UPI0030F0542F